MGQAQGRAHKGNETSEVDDMSGRVNQFPLPWDAIIHVLAFVPGKDLVKSCRLVNSTWRDAVDNPHVWLPKMDREGIAYPPLADMERDGLDWKKIYIMRPFGRNLLKNWDGSAGFNHWTITSNGGDRFKLEPAEKPGGSQPVPAELGCKNCWATSYGDCTKHQIIDLVANGVDPKYIDMKQPPIEVSVWVANRYDCASRYKMKVFLLEKNEDKTKRKDRFIEKERNRAQWVENDWEKISHTFTNYGAGVRKVTFKHRGIDGQFWAGHFGPKMAAPSVKVVIS